MRLNPVLHRMLYSCATAHMATVWASKVNFQYTNDARIVDCRVLVWWWTVAADDVAWRSQVLCQQQLHDSANHRRQRRSRSVPGRLAAAPVAAEALQRLAGSALDWHGPLEVDRQQYRWRYAEPSVFVIRLSPIVNPSFSLLYSYNYLPFKANTINWCVSAPGCIIKLANNIFLLCH